MKKMSEQYDEFEDEDNCKNNDYKAVLCKKCNIIYDVYEDKEFILCPKCNSKIKEIKIPKSKLEIYKKKYTIRYFMSYCRNCAKIYLRYLTVCEDCNHKMEPRIINENELIELKMASD